MKAGWTFVLAGLLAVPAVTEADAQTGPYPNKPVQIITESSAGSTPDVTLRIVADGLTQGWKQQVLVNNHPGAGGSLAVRLAAAAAPDGYTLYQPALSTFVSLRSPAPNIPVHVPQDFLPIGFVAENPMFIAVAPSLGILTLSELIARAKKAPGEITYATTGVGRLTHLTGELLQREAGIKLLVVPYTGGPSHAVTDVATGRVAMIIEGYSGVAGAARSGSIKLIAVASAKRLVEFPDIPTVAETIPDFQATGWAVLVAPIGTSEVIIDKISEDLRKVTLDPELQRSLRRWGATPIRCRLPRPPPSFTSSSRRGNRSSTRSPKTSAEGGRTGPHCCWQWDTTNPARACTHKSPANVLFRANRTLIRDRRMTESDPYTTSLHRRCCSPAPTR